MKEKQFNKQDYFDLEHTIEDLELMHDQYKETKEELYQLNVKHGALLGAVYSLRNFLTEQNAKIRSEHKASEDYCACSDCGNNQEQEILSGRMSENSETSETSKQFEKLFKDLI